MLRTLSSFFLITLPCVLSIIVTDPPPSPEDYVYSYNIEDPTTGDSKSQHEVRKGDFVSGAYSVVGPDGTKRIVEYTADSKHGFKAVLREEPVEVSTAPPPSEVPRYITNRKKPVAYALVPKKIYKQDIYFVPENEIHDEKLVFENGKYFTPA